MNKRTEDAVQRDAAALEVPAQQPEAAAQAAVAAAGGTANK